MTVIDVLHEKGEQIKSAKEMGDVIYTVDDVRVLMNLTGLRTLKLVSKGEFIQASSWTDETLFEAIKEGRVHGLLAVLVFSVLRNPAISGSARQVFSEVFQ